MPVASPAPRLYVELEVTDVETWTQQFTAGAGARRAAGVAHEVVFPLEPTRLAVILTWAGRTATDPVWPELDAPWPGGAPGLVRRLVPLGPVD